MESVDDDDLLDIGDVECAWSEGGDSLLDSEEENEGNREKGCGVKKRGKGREERSEGEERRGRMSNLSLSSGPPAPASLPQSASANPPTYNTTAQKSPKIIRLDGKRKFRYVSDSLPDVPLPKRAMSRRKPIISRPRRITKPSLLLEPRKMFPSEPMSDLRNTIVANRMTQLESRKTDLARICDSGSLSLRTGTDICTWTCDGTDTQRASVEHKLHTATATNSIFATKTVLPSLCNQPPSQPQRIALTDTYNSSFTIAPSDSLSKSGLPTSHTAPLSFTDMETTLFSNPDPQHRTALSTGNSSNVERGLFAGDSKPATQPASLFKTTSVTPVLGQHNFSSWLHTPSHLSTSQPPLSTTQCQANGESQSVNPFYAKMQELPQKFSSPDEDLNPFLTALQKEVVITPHQNAISGLTSSSPSSQKFSFSLAQITS